MRHDGSLPASQGLLPAPAAVAMASPLSSSLLRGSSCCFHLPGHGGRPQLQPSVPVKRHHHFSSRPDRPLGGAAGIPRGIARGSHAAVCGWRYCTQASARRAGHVPRSPARDALPEEYDNDDDTKRLSVPPELLGLQVNTGRRDVCASRLLAGGWSRRPVAGGAGTSCSLTSPRTFLPGSLLSARELWLQCRVTQGPRR